MERRKAALASLERRTFVMGMTLVLAGCGAPMALRRPDFSSARISVETVGTGPDVVLIHGLGSSREVWRDTTRAVPGFRYHLVQIKGFAGYPAEGNSSPPVIASTAEEIARYIREAGLKRPAVVGHSMGGTIALSIAARHDIVSRVLVVDMLPALGVLFVPPGAGPEALRKTADGLRDRSLAATPEERRRTVQASIATMVRTEALRAAPVRDALASDQQVSANAFHELIITDLRPELPGIKAPVTVLYVKTPNVPLTEDQFDAVYKSSYASLSAVSLKRLPESYHFVMYDAPERFAEELRSFLSESPTS